MLVAGGAYYALRRREPAMQTEPAVQTEPVADGVSA
jgi:hypothetical protein